MESNPFNYEEGTLKRHQDLQPSELRIYKGMQVYLTRNVRKDVDYVNGMRCMVEAIDTRIGVVTVLTQTGFRVAVYPWTDTELGNHTYFPMRPGYASTVIKFGGAELSHVVVFLDAPCVPGAAYTAMSRVSHYDNVLLAGKLTADHIAPAL